MAAKLAILAALVACASAAGVRQNSKGSKHVAYEWAAMSNVDRKFFNTDNTFFFANPQTQKLTFNVEVLRSLKGVTADFQVIAQQKSGRWQITQLEQDVEINTENTPESFSAYATLLGLRDSQPAIISQNSQSSGGSSLSQSAEASGAQSEAVQSGEAASAQAGQSGNYQGIAFLENFRPQSSQISKLVGTGRQLLQMTFKSGSRQIMTAEVMMNIKSLGQ